MMMHPIAVLVSVAWGNEVPRFDIAELAEADTSALLRISECKSDPASCLDKRQELARAYLVHGYTTSVVDGQADPLAVANAWVLDAEQAAAWGMAATLAPETWVAELARGEVPDRVNEEPDLEVYPDEPKRKNNFAPRLRFGVMGALGGRLPSEGTDPVWGGGGAIEAFIDPAKPVTVLVRGVAELDTRKLVLPADNGEETRRMDSLSMGVYVGAGPQIRTERFSLAGVGGVYAAGRGVTANTRQDWYDADQSDPMGVEWVIGPGTTSVGPFAELITFVPFASGGTTGWSGRFGGQYAKVWRNSKYTHPVYGVQSIEAPDVAGDEGAADQVSLSLETGPSLRLPKVPLTLEVLGTLHYDHSLDAPLAADVWSAGGQVRVTWWVAGERRSVEGS